MKTPQYARCPLKSCANDPEAEKPAFYPMVAWLGIVEGVETASFQPKVHKNSNYLNNLDF
jgi:hypothetical protein